MSKSATYAKDIVSVIIAQGPKVRKISAQEIVKQVASKRNAPAEKVRGPVKLALKKLVESKSLVQLKGTGASGSFKLNKVSRQEATALGKSYQGAVSSKALPKTMKTVKKVLAGKKVAPKKKPAKKAAPKPSAAAKKATKAAPAPAAKKAAAKKPTAKAAAKKAAKSPKKAPAAAAKKKAKK